MQLPQLPQVPRQAQHGKEAGDEDVTEDEAEEEEEEEAENGADAQAGGVPPGFENLVAGVPPGFEWPVDAAARVRALAEEAAAWRERAAAKAVIDALDWSEMDSMIFASMK